MADETALSCFQQLTNEEASSSRLPFNGNLHFLTGRALLNSAIRILSSKAFSPTHRPRSSATKSELMVLEGTMIHPPPRLTKFAQMILRSSFISSGDTVLSRSNRSEEPLLTPPFSILSRFKLPVENNVSECSIGC